MKKKGCKIIIGIKRYLDMVIYGNSNGHVIVLAALAIYMYSMLYIAKPLYFTLDIFISWFGCKKMFSLWVTTSLRERLMKYLEVIITLQTHRKYHLSDYGLMAPVRPFILVLILHYV